MSKSRGEFKLGMVKNGVGSGKKGPEQTRHSNPWGREERHFFIEDGIKLRTRDLLCNFTCGIHYTYVLGLNDVQLGM
jgi:hypothetical protein